MVGLLTTVTEPFRRVSMHGVRLELVEAQARELRLPLWRVEIPSPCSNAEYEARMGAAIAALQADGVSRVIFGDLFLADVRAYRERQLEGTGMEPMFPLWGRNTRDLVREMLTTGLATVVVCVDPRRLSPDYAGRWLTLELVDGLPAVVDPCGENGEFHTFVCAGPIFKSEINARVGEVVERDGFYFADILPA